MENSQLNKPIQIMLVEDQAAYREVITIALEREDAMELASQFGTAEFALRKLQSTTGNSIPDVILLDLNLPGMGGLESIPWLKKHAPKTKIIILTQSNSEADVLQAIQAGASGYLLKSSTPKEIKRSIHTVIDGGAALDASVASFILNTLKAKLPETSLVGLLSQRELETLSLLADGLSKKEIAEQMSISEYTVVYHVKNIYEKLDATNAPSAISKAYQNGILPVKDS